MYSKSLVGNLIYNDIDCSLEWISVILLLQIHTKWSLIFLCLLLVSPPIIQFAFPSLLEFSPINNKIRQSAKHYLCSPKTNHRPTNQILIAILVNSVLVLFWPDEAAIECQRFLDSEDTEYICCTVLSSCPSIDMVVLAQFPLNQKRAYLFIRAIQ